MVWLIISRDNTAGRSTTCGGRPQTSNQTRGRAPFGSSTGRVSFFHGSFYVFLLQFWRNWRSVRWSEEDWPWGVWSHTSITDKGQQEVQNNVIVCGCDRNEPISKFRYTRLAACSGHRGMDLAFVDTFPEISPPNWALPP